MKTFALLTTVLLAAAPSLAQVNPILGFEWDCSTSPETCNNACYLLFVYGSRLSTLTFDASGRGNRPTLSGCSRNPCNNANLPYGGSGNSCDEYPFASTTQGGTGASLRCVASADNTNQGTQLRLFYQSFGRTDRQGFNVFVNNFDNRSPYCQDNPPGNDGFQFRLQNGAFTTFRRSLGLPDGASFEDNEPPVLNRTVAKLRHFEDDVGSRLLLLGEAEEGQDFIGMPLWSNGTWKVITKELFD